MRKGSYFIGIASFIEETVRLPTYRRAPGWKHLNFGVIIGVHRLADVVLSSLVNTKQDVSQQNEEIARGEQHELTSTQEMDSGIRDQDMGHLRLRRM